MKLWSIIICNLYISASLLINCFWVYTQPFLILDHVIGLVAFSLFLKCYFTSLMDDDIFLIRGECKFSDVADALKRMKWNEQLKCINCNDMASLVINCLSVFSPPFFNTQPCYWPNNFFWGVTFQLWWWWYSPNKRGK